MRQILPRNIFPFSFSVICGSPAPYRSPFYFWRRSKRFFGRRDVLYYVARFRGLLACACAMLFSAGENIFRLFAGRFSFFLDYLNAALDTFGPQPPGSFRDSGTLGAAAGGRKLSLPGPS